MDKYASIRNLPFPAVANLLGLDFSRFKQKKSEYQGYCPIHESKENNNCFSYNTDTGTYHCFSCQAKGKGSIDLVMAVKGIKFTEACEFLSKMPAEAPKIALDESKSVPAIVSSVEQLKPLVSSYHKFQVESEWLNARIPDKVVLERYGVFAYNNPARKSAYSGRIMLPIKGLDGTLYGYLARSTNGEPKYLFPKDFPKHLFCFGACELHANGHQLPLRIVYLVESPFCCLKYACYGLPCVSPFGWSVSEEQIQILKQLARGILYIPDRNKYSDSRAVVSDIGSHLWVKAPPLPEGVDDPEYLSKEQILAL